MSDMWKVVPLALLQSMLLAGGQVFLKFALGKLRPFGWTYDFWRSFFTNWQMAACGISFLAASLLWIYMIKRFPLSIAYPLGSLTYVFGMVAAIIFFHESIPATRWLGALLIVLGCCLIAK